jgi:4-amino-4-deoxy-L-arabinose transferase-like glycosyltransferase
MHNLRNTSLPALKPTLRYADLWTLLAVVLAVFYLGTTIYIGSQRPFWTDEILTVDIAQLPDYRTIWSAVTHAVDGGSPVYDVVVRMSDKLLGDREVAARLPSALAMVAGMLIAFDCARRLTDSLHGLIAISVLTCSFLPYYGHEARSYAIYFMLAALSLWIWVHARDDNRSSAVLFGAVVFLAVTMHYYAVLCLVPYALWEVSRWEPWQPPSAKLIAGVVGAVVALALLWPAILAFMPVVVAYAGWAGPSLDGLRAIFPALFSDGLWLLALIMVWIAFAEAKSDDVVLQPMRPSEAISWLFLCIPLAGFVVAELKTNAFLARYFIAALPGVAVAFSCLLWRHFHQARHVSIGVFLILATWGVAKQVTVTRHPDIYYFAPIRQVLSSENALRNDGKRFFAVSNQARYLEARHYSKHPEAYAFLASMDSGDQHQSMALARYYPMQIWTLGDLKKHARETALLMPSLGNLDTLKQAGFEVEVRFSNRCKWCI